VARPPRRAGHAILSRNARAWLAQELNDPVAADQKVTVRTDGLELLISSNRAGSFGNFDIWRSTRETVQEPWSTPVHIGPPLNTADVDSQPTLSRDGQTLIFTSTRPGGFGNNDLWMSTRRPGSP
jgi:WD40-like Beta Propeller Repeat